MPEETGEARSAPLLEQDDARLLSEIHRVLTERAAGNPYGVDGGDFAGGIQSLPVGLRAMAATYWLDVSLTLDSITWHFGNFGHPDLVRETEAGLRELGLHDLAACFTEAKELMVPLLAHRTEGDGDPYQILKHAGSEERARKLDERAWKIDGPDPERSVIFEAWIRYARQHPERVFGDSRGMSPTT